MNAAFATRTLVVFTLTMFASATLLFLVQPMVGKIILPKFGGTPAVWSTCMVFFQATLLLGYSYAHALNSWFTLRQQVIVHLIVLALPVLAFVIFPLHAYYQQVDPPSDANPAFYVLLILTQLIGVPFLVVSTSAPLLQRWFSQTGHPAAKDPYFLYAASNLGSMLSLFLYPAAVEPSMRVAWQGILWMAGYGLLAVMTVACALLTLRAAAPKLALAAGPRPDAEPPKPSEQIMAEPSSERLAALEQITEKANSSADPAPRPGDLLEVIPAPPAFVQQLHWIALAFVPSSLMLGVTTYMTMDISAIPLLWLPPLTLYLLTFILVFSKTANLLPRMICFDLPNLPLRFLQQLIPTSGFPWSFLQAVLQFFIRIFEELGRNFTTYQIMILMMPVVVLLSIFMTITESHPPSFFGIHSIVWQFVQNLITLFIVAMVCHGELARLRPAPQYLTSFYLCMSVGGVLGGIFNALIAPNIFFTVAEYPLVLTLACLFLPALTAKQCAANRWLESGMILLLLAVCVLASYQHFQDWRRGVVTLFPEIFGSLPGWNVKLLSGLAKLGRLAIVILLLVYGGVAGFRARHKPSLVITHLLNVFLPLLLGLVAAQFLFRVPFTASWLDAPWFTSLWEDRLQLPSLEQVEPERVALILTCTLLVLIVYGFSLRPVRFALGVGALLLVSSWANVPTNVLIQQRSFFCVYRVQSVHYSTGHYNKLVHGTTMHGQQRLDSDPVSLAVSFAPLASSGPFDAAIETVVAHEARRDRRNEPLTYFHKTGPIGQIFAKLVREPDDRRPIAVLGLGTGTLAGYILPGQELTFYEIDPLAVAIATNSEYFTYVNECRGKVQIILGDGRLKLKEAPDGKFRMLFMDAFSSDSIPIHLVTREAIQLYFEKLTPDGVLVVNVSNRYLEPAPVLANIAKDLGLVAMNKWDGSDNIPGKAASDWVVIARKQEDLAGLRGVPLLDRTEWKVNALLGMGQTPMRLPVVPIKDLGWSDLKADPQKPLWTDDFSNLLSILRRKAFPKGEIRKGAAPAEPRTTGGSRLGRSRALPSGTDSE